MNKERLKELVGDERWISGIYNYCDQWCERCPQTARCLNHAMTREEPSDPETLDIRNQAYWNKLAGTFQVTIDLLKESAAREGIDPDELDLDADEEQDRIDEEAADSHEVCRAARAYSELAEAWFQKAKAFLEAGEETGLRPSPPLPHPAEPAGTDLDDALEVVRWYQNQIYVKGMRAVRGRMNEEVEPSDEMDQVARDSDGSAKVALIGIDRSTAAWGTIRNQFPYHDPEVISILTHLDRLRKKVEKAFPNARAFLRPGFDQIDLNG